jgi:hypothetical protein
MKEASLMPVLKLLKNKADSKDYYVKIPATIHMAGFTFEEPYVTNIGPLKE